MPLRHALLRICSLVGYSPKSSAAFFIILRIGRLYGQRGSQRRTGCRPRPWSAGWRTARGPTAAGRTGLSTPETERRWGSRCPPCRGRSSCSGGRTGCPARRGRLAGGLLPGGKRGNAGRARCIVFQLLHRCHARDGNRHRRVGQHIPQRQTAVLDRTAGQRLHVDERLACCGAAVDERPACCSTML